MAEDLTTAQVAAYLGRSERTVRDQIAKGAIAATRVGRDWLINPDEVERYRRESLGRPGRRPKG